MDAKSFSINSRQNILIFAILFIAITLSSLFSFHCKSIGKEKGNSEYKTMNKKDTTILIRKQYLITVPKSYNINSGVGDDTEFVQIINEDGSIVIGYETGVEDILINKIITIHSIKRNYDKTDKIKKIDNENLWIVYNSTTNKFRDIKGSVFIEHKTGLKEILNFSCSSSQVSRVIQLVSTLKSNG